MLREIILLTGAREAPYLGGLLRKHNPDLRITHAETRDELTLAAHPRRQGVRLVAFCTSVVVSRSILADIDGRAYNFHPGPPEYPGRHPASFAIYDGARQFGATVHEMMPAVDSGAIVAAERFDMPATPRLSQLEGLAYEATLRLFAATAPALARSLEPLEPNGAQWSGRKSSQRDYDALCRLPADIDAMELDRRQRAFADGLSGMLTINVHGRTFRLDS
jgi:methionyl-tRNA formyltransferase